MSHCISWCRWKWALMATRRVPETSSTTWTTMWLLFIIRQMIQVQKLLRMSKTCAHASSLPVSANVYFLPKQLIDYLLKSHGSWEMWITPTINYPKYHSGSCFILSSPRVLLSAPNLFTCALVCSQLVHVCSCLLLHDSDCLGFVHCGTIVGGQSQCTDRKSFIQRDFQYLYWWKYVSCWIEKMTVYTCRNKQKRPVFAMLKAANCKWCNYAAELAEPPASAPVADDPTVCPL